MDPFDSEEIREPVWAGRFYPAQVSQCRAQAKAFVVEAPEDRQSGIARPIGGIVPHAGWICSGAIAGQTMAALLRKLPAVDVVVVFGAIHTPLAIESAALASQGRWAVPGGESEVAVDVERKLVETAELFHVDDRFHLREHAVEVELPLIQQAWPDAAVLPIEIPLIEDAARIGAATAQRIAAAGLSAVYLASSDFTHYGPDYGFVPAGVGLDALEWAKDNDRRLLDLVTAMKVDQVVPEVRQSLNACGGGAIAAMLAACREAGATRAAVLRHANSFETLAGIYPQQPENAVGYAAVVVG